MLSQISEDGFVCGFNNGPNAKRVTFEGDLGFQKIHVSRASTFPGFCGKHDNEVFKKVENRNLNRGYQDARLSAYRAHCYETVIHTNAAVFQKWLLDAAKIEFPFEPDIMVNETHNMLVYARYCWELKKTFEKIIGKKSVRKLYFHTAIIEGTLPFCGTGSFCIETDFKGRKLQRFGGNGPFNYAQLSVLPLKNGNTFFSISAVNDKNDKAAHDFVCAISEVPDMHLAEAALKACLCHTENTYFRPSFLDSLSESQLSRILFLFDDSNVMEVGKEKESNALIRPTGILFENKVLERNSNLRKGKL